MVDLPFALPTAVAGIALTAIYASNGWVGQYLEPLGVQIAFTPAGVVIALMFIGLPFVVRTVEPVLADMGREVEEAAASLGESRFTTFRKVILRSEESRVGKECVRTCRFRRWTSHLKKNK